MIKNFFKKILCFAVLISMLFSSIGTVDTAYAADLSGITRSEWVSKLVSTFNMQVDDESNMPDNYFNDITSDMDCYKDILLAVEFGVIDLEAGQSFRPYDPATREFAAQTLNYCLGFKLDEGIAYTFNDSANVTYKDDAQVALNRGWFPLNNGKFCPEQTITESEMNTMLSDAVSVISGDAVSGTKNIFGVADGVIVVPETATVSIDNNGILTIGNYEGTLQTGDIFVVTLEGFPVAFQAVDVQQSDAGFIIETETNEDTDNAITSIQNEGTSDFDLEQFEVAEGATYRIVDESKGRSAGYETLSIEPYSIKYDKKSKKLTITESVKLNNVAAGTLTVAMKNIKIEQEIREKIEEADLIIFSAGSLYTSIVPHLLAPEVRSALEETKAPLLYISNLVTQPGETDIQTVSRHVEILNEYLGSRKIDLVVANNGTVDENVRERYLSAENKRIVQVDHITLEKMGVQIIEDDIFCIEDEKIRHNALKTAFLIFSYLMEA